MSFSHLDWEIACDKTLTCRAAGYGPEDPNMSVSVLLTRVAGPDQPVAAQVQLGHYDEKVAAQLPTQVQITVDGRLLGSVKLAKDSATGRLNPAQTAALLSAVLGRGSVAWNSGAQRWQLSGNGANAVLLKMDEVQGRLRKPGALVRKGSRAKTEVLRPLAMPVITAARTEGRSFEGHPGACRAQDAVVELVKTGADKDCERFADVMKGEAELAVYRLARDKLLIEAQCWLAAYNGGAAYWTANAQPPFAPRLVKVEANAYENGRVLSENKGRGLGDCWSHAEWTWDGKQFLQSATYQTGLCRFIAPGGAWVLPTLSTVVKETP